MQAETDLSFLVSTFLELYKSFGNRSTLFNLILYAAMAKSIKLFQPTEKVYELLGIETSQPTPRERVSFQWLFLLICTTIHFVSSLGFFMFEAKKVADRGDSFYQVSTQVATIFHIITYPREVPNIRQLIGKYEHFFEDSKFSLVGCFQSFFFEMNLLIENVSFIYFFLNLSNRIERSGNSSSIYRTAREN